MDLFHREDLRILAARQEAPCVTIMMPTAHVEADLGQNPIRLKNLIKKAAEELKDAGYREDVVQPLLAPARDLLENDQFWLKLNEGLVLFLAPEEARIYRLPLELEELVVTGNRFHLKPLFPLIASNNRFYVLALSQNRVQLFQATHFSMNEVHTSEIPRSLVSALALDDPEKSLQMHSGVKFNKGRHDQIYHGHGHPNEDFRARPQDALKRFFQQIDSGIRKVLGDDDALMILAGVSYYLPIYREVNKYGAMVDDEIVAGNPEHLSPKELHDRAWELVEPIFTSTQKDSVDKFQRLYNNGGELASSDLKEIVPASVFHRVDTLFVPIGEHRWGTFDSANNAVELHDEHLPGDEDLLDLAAVHTYLNGGTVHALQEQNMPVQEAVAATFRYAPGAPAYETNGSDKQ